ENIVATAAVELIAPIAAEYRFACIGTVKLERGGGIGLLEPEDLDVRDRGIIEHACIVRWRHQIKNVGVIRTAAHKDDKRVSSISPVGDTDMRPAADRQEDQRIVAALAAQLIDAAEAAVERIVGRVAAEVVIEISAEKVLDVGDRNGAAVWIVVR